MHAYYASRKEKLRKGMNQFLSLVAPELEKASGKKYQDIFDEIWCDIIYTTSYLCDN